MATLSAASVIFIGPVCAGKSTLAGLVASNLGWPRASLDDLVWTYGASEGSRDKRLRPPLPELFVRAVERIVAEHPGHVIDLGAGHTHINDPNLFRRLRHAVAPCRDVILLLPSRDPDESIEILKERARRLRGHDWVRNGVDHIARWVRDPPNYELATHIVYTENQTPQQSCDLLLRGLADSGESPSPRA